jgi:hypothetical protein
VAALADEHDEAIAKTLERMNPSKAIAILWEFRFSCAGSAPIR